MTRHTETIEIITRDQRRRRWSRAEKASLVRKTYEPGMSVSLVARQEGLAVRLLFTWRRLEREGALVAVGAGEAVVPASELAAGRMKTSSLLTPLDETEPLRTPEQVRSRFELSGVSVAAWARSQGFNVTLTYMVAAGQRRNLRGQSHKIAVALGMKRGDDSEL